MGAADELVFVRKFRPFVMTLLHFVLIMYKYIRKFSYFRKICKKVWNL